MNIPVFIFCLCPFSFYIMLSGRMSVYIDTARADDEEDVTSSTARDVTDNNDDVSEGEGQVKRKPLDRSKFGKFIMYLGKAWRGAPLSQIKCLFVAFIVITSSL